MRDCQPKPPTSQGSHFFPSAISETFHAAPDMLHIGWQATDTKCYRTIQFAQPDLFCLIGAGVRMDWCGLYGPVAGQFQTACCHAFLTSHCEPPRPWRIGDS